MKPFKDLEIFAVYIPCLYGEDGDLEQQSIYLTYERAVEYKVGYDNRATAVRGSKILMDVQMLPDSIKSLFKQ